MVQNVHTYRWFFDVSWFMVTFTMWNVIKGITIDIFVELRQIKEDRIADTEKKCFICGIDKLVFNRALDRDAFDAHIKHDQNLWNYVYYCIFIWEQDKDDDDGLEYYVRHCIDDGDLSWFPMNKAIRLMEHLEKGAVGSLPYEFRQCMGDFEDQFDKRMGQLKDQVTRSINRVEQALIFVPEANVKKGKKAKSGNDDESIGTSHDGGKDIPPAEGAFRPGTTAMAFMNNDATFGEVELQVHDGASQANDNSDVLRMSHSRKMMRLSTAQNNAYMDSMQCKIAVSEVDGLLVRPDMYAGVSVRITSDTGIYIGKAILTESQRSGAALAEQDGIEEQKSTISEEALKFNENEYFVVHGGALDPSVSYTVTVQLFHEKKLSPPENLVGRVPETAEKYICGTEVDVRDLIKVGNGNFTFHLPQKGREVDDALVSLNVACSAAMVEELEKSRQ